MNYDCNTKIGKVYTANQICCANKLSDLWKVDIILTATDDIADIDALGVKDGFLKSVMEIKSREMDVPQLRKYGSYLITFDKLLKLRQIAMALRVPGLIIVSLLKDGAVVYWKICDKEGNFLPALECKISTTQATCNGGLTDRYNAYLSVEDMEIAIKP